MDEIDAIREARKEDAAFFERNPKVRDLVVDEVYPDKVHFIYELLQNAEDAGAKEVSFTLRDTELVFEHNGTRYFGREDVEAITKIAAGTKTSDSGKIGRFGIGFKSVFAFTETPQIWSPGHSFEIRNFVMPYKLDMIEEVKEGKITRFAFPFNGKKKAPNVAQKEIHDGLLEISEKTLLFLTGIESIKWAVIGGPSGEVLRIPHTTNHIEVLKQVNGEFSSGSHYLRFMEPAKVYPKQFVAIAFELNQLPSTEKNSDGRLDRNFTISSAKPGTVSVFFPAAKETSGLRFHIHAPFVPELSRASIRDIPENIPLIEQISGLAARSLADLREMGVLGVAALAVVPHNGDELPMRYQDIRNKMLAALRTQSLIPKHSGGHSPAMSLVRASTTVKQMISPADLRVILDSKTDLEWAVSVPKGSSQDQLFQSLQMPALDGDDLCGRLQKGTWSHDGPLVSWLSSKPGHWLQSLYAYLHKHIAGNYLAHQWKALMSEWHIVRSKNGAMRKGKECFFPSTLIDDGEALPPVDESTYCVKAEADGKWTSVEEPYTVLRWCGVSDVSEEDRLKVILRDRYSNDSDDPTWEEHIQDIGRLVRAFERSAAIAKLLSESHFIKSENGDWFRPDGIYLDAPFLETGLSEYFKAAPLEESLFLPSSEYLSEENGIPRQTFIRMLVAAGAQDRIALNTESCYSNPHRSALLNAPGGFSQKYHLDEDFTIRGVDKILNSPPIEISKAIWKCLMEEMPRRWHLARYRNNSNYQLNTAPSQLAIALDKAAWVPQVDGSPTRPCEARKDKLPEGFTFDPGWEWIKALRFGQELPEQEKVKIEEEQKAKELGLSGAATLGRARLIDALSLEDQRQLDDFLSRRANRNSTSGASSIEIDAQTPVADDEPLPELESANPELRAQRVADAANNAPDRETSIRERSVSNNREAIKAEAKPYLQQSYTKNNGEMICQICMGNLPFRVNGVPFFEAVEFIDDMPRFYRENYLALCPNHAAMFRFANEDDRKMEVIISSDRDNRVSCKIAGAIRDIYFTKSHLADIKAIVNAIKKQ